MARKGKFGRSASGSQNLSALIYALLKEERQDQEQTMLTAYNNNMRSGSAAGLFTIDGVTRAATADNIVAWYLAQAATALAAGDSGGAERLKTKAEEFRIASLRDYENILDSAYQNGNSIDLSLVGGSGTGKITDAEYERFVTRIATDPSMTDSDRERLNNKMFTISYNSSASRMVNGFKENKFTANQLVNFYDKELIRAKEAGLTEESRTYQDILAARADAIARRESDVGQARVDKIDRELMDETDAIARGVQKLIGGVLKDYLPDMNSVSILNNDIKNGSGDDWLSNFSNVLNDNKVDVQSIIESAMSLYGLDDETARNIMDQLELASDDIKRLQEQGYGKELQTWPSFISGFSAEFSKGIFVATSKKAVEDLSISLNRAGASISVPNAADQSATQKALTDFVGTIGGAGFENIADSNIPTTIVGINNGDVAGLFGGNDPMTIGELITKIAGISGQSEYDVANQLGQTLTQLEANEDLTALGSFGDALMQIGLNRPALMQQIGSNGSMTVADVLRLKIDSTEKPRLITEDKNLVLSYRWDPNVRYFTFQAINKFDVQNKDKFLLAYDSAGKPYYVEQREVTGQSNIKFIPVPGGGSGSGRLDSNDIIQFKAGEGLFYRFSFTDLERMKSWASERRNDPGYERISGLGIDGRLPTLVVDEGGNISDASIGDFYVKIFQDKDYIALFANDMGSERGMDGQMWLDTKTVTDGSYVGTSNLKGDLTSLFGKYGSGTPDEWKARVSEWLTSKGIDDRTGDYTNLLINSLTVDKRNLLPRPGDGSTGTGGGQGAIPQRQPGATDVATSDPSFFPGRPPAAAASQIPTASGLTSGYGTPGVPYVNPTSDYMAYTLRNLGGESMPRPGATAPATDPGLRDSRPPVNIPKPTPVIAPSVPTIGPGRAPRLGSAPTSFRQSPTQSRVGSGGGRYADRIAR